MKFLAKVALFALLSGSASAYAGQIYFYEVEVTNGVIPKSDTDGIAKAVAAVLSQKQSDACIDLRMLGSSSTGNQLSHGTVGLLTNQELRRSVDKAMQAVACPNSAPGCKVELRSLRFESGDLTLSAYGPPDRSRGDSGSYQKAASLAGKAMLPRMSDACSTGKYADSWNNTASPAEAKAYIKKLGIDLDMVRTLSLLRSNGKEVWSFGFPRHDKSSGKKL